MYTNYASGDKVPATQAGATNYATAHGIRVGYGRTALEALIKAGDGSFGAFLQAMNMEHAMRQHNLRNTGAGSIRRRKIAIVMLDGWTDAVYATALHELGHLLSPNQSGAVDDPRDEIDAWRWAKAHAEKWTAEMERDARVALDSYGVRQFPDDLRA